MSQSPNKCAIDPELCRGIPQTWYLDTLQTRQSWPELDHELDVDVCIVGGGLAGLCTGVELIERGMKVAILEANSVGWGASGRNAGIVAAGFACEVDELKRKLGSEKTQLLFNKSVEGVDWVRTRIEQLVPDAFMGKGLLSLDLHHSEFPKSEADVLQSQPEDQKEEVLSREDIGRMLKTGFYSGGTRDTSSFHIHPMRYVQGLAGYFCNSGGMIFEHSPATALDHTVSGYVVRTPKNLVRAKTVMICTGAYSKRIFPAAGNYVIPVSTYVVVSAPLTQAQHAVIDTQQAIADTRRAGDYYRKLEDGRLLWGGKINTFKSPPQNLKRIMERAILKVYPQLKGLKLEYAWTGMMSYATHKMPIIQNPKQDLWYASCFGGHGLNTTALAGQLVASAIANNDESWKCLSDMGYGFRLGGLSRLAVQTSYWGMQGIDMYRSVMARLR